METDWGRYAAPWWGRSAGGLRLAELGRLVGNLDYAWSARPLRGLSSACQPTRNCEQLANVQLQLSK
jgi:hypothetical protein